jgi:hypothetical protein
LSLYRTVRASVDGLAETVSSRPRAHDRQLAALLRQNVAARDGLTEALRAPGSGHSVVPGARARLLAALEAYVCALEARGLPTPRRLRDELRLQRALATVRDTHGRRRPGVDA